MFHTAMNPTKITIFEAMLKKLSKYIYIILYMCTYLTTVGSLVYIYGVSFRSDSSKIALVVVIALHR